MRRRLARFLLAFGLTAAPVAQMQAQDRATLVADDLRIQGDTTLIADGHVEIFYMGQRVTASKIVYDQTADRLVLEGPIVVNDGKGTFILASQAELKADLTEGVLTSARMVLQEQLQLSAAEIMRVGGRYTALNRVAASSCKVCAGNPTPLWEIRARRVVHDQAEQQLYFDGAQLRVAGLPVFYIPRLRMPDPTLQRATGFLIPSYRTDSTLGSGFRLPYFIKMGDHRDLLLAPFLTREGIRTVELRYRQAFATGDITLSGSLSRDDILTGQLRGYGLVTGSFALPRGFKLDLRGQGVSDRGYLLDYGYPATDRLESRLEASRVRADEYISGRLIGVQSIREGDDPATLPSLVTDLTWERRFALGPLGGTGALRFQTHGHYRASTDPIDGRDVRRLSLQADWRRDWLLNNGMQLAVLGEGSADAYVITEAGNTSQTAGRLHGIGAELRWPWAKQGARGVTQVIEPVAQLIYSPTSSVALPNEDSTLLEFDEGNLFALNRFPGSDAVESGLRANLGLSYLRSDPNGWSLGLTAGRVLREADLGQFNLSSGLAGLQSDWMAAWQLKLADGFGLTNRLIFDDAFALTKGELRFGLSRDRYDVMAGYVYTLADPAENRAEPISEFALESQIDMTQAWTARMDGRYDFKADRAAKAGLGLTFRNECLTVDLSLSRRFTSSTSVEPATEFGLKVELLGFGGGSDPGAARQCRR